MTMPRRTEPELMDDELQAKAYAQADFAYPNSLFVRAFAERFPEFSGGLMLDLGCGPGDIVLRLARAYPEAVVHGLDGSPAMLRYAESALAHAPGLRSRVRFVQGLLPGAVLPESGYDAVVSNSLLHHLHRPQGLWQTAQLAGRPGAVVCVMDLFRPESEARAAEIVDIYAAEEHELLRQDYYNSLLAAFTVDEVRAQLAEVGLPQLRVETVSAQHLMVWGRLAG